MLETAVRPERPRADLFPAILVPAEVAAAVARTSQPQAEVLGYSAKEPMVQLEVPVLHHPVPVVVVVVVAKMVGVTQVPVPEPYMVVEAFCRMAADRLTAVTGPFA